jgi:catechol 2,3-dioxygenase-like lactoylglutathione lyase family enzyme
MAKIEQSPAIPKLRLDSFSHVALPVRDLDRAELYYAQVLGAKVLNRVDVQQTPPVKTYESHLDVRWGPVDLQLFKQPFGEPTIEQAHPHYAFTTRGSLVDRWVDHFTSWGIPSVIVCRQHGKVGMGDKCAIELYFLDPDGNPLELDADDYIFSERVVWAPYDHFSLLYHGGEWWEEHKHRFKPHKV